LEVSVQWGDNQAHSKCQEVQLEQQQLLTHLLEQQVQPMLLVPLEPLELQEQLRQILLPLLVAWEAWAAWVACQALILT
jgi:hypothetical protein